MRRAAKPPTSPPNMVERSATAAAPYIAPRRRDQPFLEVLQEVAIEMESSAVQLDSRREHGKPTVADTRLPVSVVLTYLAAGYTLEQIAETFGVATVEELRGAVEYAAEVLDQDVGE